jgi:hypothetical protein
LELDVTIPAGAVATAILPVADADVLKEGKVSATYAAGACKLSHARQTVRHCGSAQASIISELTRVEVLEVLART